MTTSTIEQPAARPGIFERMRSRADSMFDYVGGLTDLAGQTLQQIRRGPVERPLLIAQFDQIGVRSLSIVIITSAFIGMVLALQTAYALQDFGGKLFVGMIDAEKPKKFAKVLVCAGSSVERTRRS